MKKILSLLVVCATLISVFCMSGCSFETTSPMPDVYSIAYRCETAENGTYYYAAAKDMYGNVLDVWVTEDSDGNTSTMVVTLYVLLETKEKVLSTSYNYAKFRSVDGGEFEFLSEGGISDPTALRLAKLVSDVKADGHKYNVEEISALSPDSQAIYKISEDVKCEFYKITDDYSYTEAAVVSETGITALWLPADDENLFKTEDYINHLKIKKLICTNYELNHTEDLKEYVEDLLEERYPNLKQELQTK